MDDPRTTQAEGQHTAATFGSGQTAKPDDQNFV